MLTLPLPSRGADPGSRRFPALPGLRGGLRVAVPGQGVHFGAGWLHFGTEPSVLAETCLALQGSGSQSLSGAGVAQDAHGIAQGAGL